MRAVTTTTVRRRRSCSVCTRRPRHQHYRCADHHREQQHGVLRLPHGRVHRLPATRRLAHDVRLPEPRHVAGEATYTDAYVRPPTPVLRTRAPVRSGRRVGYAGGDCKNCHDVHGTAGRYDELAVARVQRPPRFSFCFDCHDSGVGQRQHQAVLPDDCGRHGGPGRHDALRSQDHHAGRAARRFRDAVLRLPQPARVGAAYGLQVVTMSERHDDRRGRRAPARSTMTGTPHCGRRARVLLHLPHHGRHRRGLDRLGMAVTRRCRPVAGIHRSDGVRRAAAAAGRRAATTTPTRRAATRATAATTRGRLQQRPQPVRRRLHRRRALLRLPRAYKPMDARRHRTTRHLPPRDGLDAATPATSLRTPAATRPRQPTSSA